MTSTAVEQRFWSKVDQSEDCWLWTAASNQYGYGRFRSGGVLRFAHRVAYEMAYGPIPGGMEIDHTCHVHACVRPEHLRVVTSKQNHENLSGAYANSKSGVRGVHWNTAKKKWHVQVGHNGGRHFGGLFENLADAEKAAIEIRNNLFTHNNLDRYGEKL